MSKEKEIKQFGSWEVSPKGDMNHDGRYSIPSNRLTEDNWIIHMQEKGWIDFNTFLPAYLQALKNAGKQFVKIKTFYS